MEEGITAPEAGFGPEPNLTIENSYLRNDTNLEVPTNGSVNGCWMEQQAGRDQQYAVRCAARTESQRHRDGRAMSRMRPSA